MSSGESVRVTTHFLQMRKTPPRASCRPPEGAQIQEVSGLSATAYRALYNGVGAPWLWYERSDMSDRELGPLIGDPAVSIFVLKSAGQQAGYTELRLGDNQAMQILYFGLRPEFIGKGLGNYFLDWTMRHAFAQDIKRLWVHTCSLDHERALPAYKRAGFACYRQESGWVTIPEAALERKLRAENSQRSRQQDTPAL